MAPKKVKEKADTTIRVSKKQRKEIGKRKKKLNLSTVELVDEMLEAHKRR